MARSQFTLAAALSSVVPEAAIVAVAPLTEGGSGRIDAVCVTLEDDRTFVVRTGTSSEADEELRADVRALRALSAGMRALLPFDAPEILGEVALNDKPAVVTSFIPGYRVDPAYVPAGPGIATAVAQALAAVHALPVSTVRDAGLIVRSATHVQEDARRLLRRAEQTRRAPLALLTRWQRAIETDALWQFEPAVVLGGASSTSFFFEDLDGMPMITGVAHWHGLSVGDPAIDLQWLASAPAAAGDVLDAYAAASDRAPDAHLRPRARLHAELEFARWLVHGHETGDEAVIADAETLLSSLADTVSGEDLVPRTTSSVDGAIALLDRVPDTASTPADTSMHTDAYDPDELAMWLPAATDDAPLTPPFVGDAAEAEHGPADSSPVSPIEPAEPPAAVSDHSEAITAPIVLPVAADPLFPATPGADADEPARAARAAFQRWTSSDSE